MQGCLQNSRPKREGERESALPFKEKGEEGNQPPPSSDLDENADVNYPHSLFVWTCAPLSFLNSPNSPPLSLSFPFSVLISPHPCVQRVRESACVRERESSNPHGLQLMELFCIRRFNEL